MNFTSVHNLYLMYEISGHPDRVQKFTVTVVTSEITLLLPIIQLYLFVENGGGGDDYLSKTLHIILYIFHLVKDLAQE